MNFPDKPVCKSPATGKHATVINGGVDPLIAGGVSIAPAEQFQALDAGG